MHGLAPLAEPVDVDERDQVVQLRPAGVLDGLPHRALGHLRVTAQHPHAVGQPVEVAPVYVFLASNESSYITGEVIGATGGRPLG